MMQWKHYVYLGFISSLSLILNIYGHQGNSTARNEMLEKLVELKNMTSQCQSDLHSLVR